MKTNTKTSFGSVFSGNSKAASAAVLKNRKIFDGLILNAGANRADKANTRRLKMFDNKISRLENFIFLIFLKKSSIPLRLEEKFYYILWYIEFLVFPVFPKLNRKEFVFK